MLISLNKSRHLANYPCFGPCPEWNVADARSSRRRRTRHRRCAAGSVYIAAARRAGSSSSEAGNARLDSMGRNDGRAAPRASPRT
jgi:hypothetical protein